ncbi:hypothetical protein SCLCIDRAFT_134908, partial [Scleroderma citrinum Foug A]
YMILSHWWIGQEHDGYQRILKGCKQAKKDRYKWLLWVDTSCIDKRSSAELSEAINSMYWWYENAQVCYAYLHNVLCSSFPIEWNNKRYANGPEWFSYGSMLQEWWWSQPYLTFGGFHILIHEVLHHCPHCHYSNTYQIL